MMLETHMKLCMAAGFSRKFFFAQKIGKMGQEWAKNKGFLIYWEILSLIVTEFVL